jgi:hypothetical protein
MAPGNPLCSSSGDTRELRKGYGADEIYTIWAMKALELWKKKREDDYLA